MLYEKLNPEMKRMVDDYARRLKVYDWGRRSELLAEVSLPFGEELDPRRAKLAAWLSGKPYSPNPLIWLKQRWANSGS